MHQQEQARARLFTRRAALLAGGQALLLSALVGRMYYLQKPRSTRCENESAMVSASGLRWVMKTLTCPSCGSRCRDVPKAPSHPKRPR